MRLNHLFWAEGGSGREELATSQCSVTRGKRFCIQHRFLKVHCCPPLILGYDLDVLCFLLTESVVLTCRVFWGRVFHSIPELVITLDDTVT